MEYSNYLIHFNPNHDPKSGRFTTGNGSSVTSKIGARLKKSDLLDENYKEYKKKSGPAYNRMKAAADTGLKALIKLGDKDIIEASNNDNLYKQGWDHWFLFEDQTYGQSQVADLANKGKTADQIKQIIKDSVEFVSNDAGNDSLDIPGVYGLYLFNEEADYMPYGNFDRFIDACIEVAKENKQVSHSGTTQFGSYLCHFNKNHSSKNGQFTFGDGDGDGSNDERGRRGRYKPEAIGNGNQPQVQYVPKGLVKGVGKLGKWAAGKAFSMTKWGKQYNEIKKNCIDVGKYTLANTDLSKSLSALNLGSLKTSKDKFVDKMYDKATNSINKRINKYVEDSYE